MWCVRRMARCWRGGSGTDPRRRSLLDLIGTRRPGGAPCSTRSAARPRTWVATMSAEASSIGLPGSAARERGHREGLLPRFAVVRGPGRPPIIGDRRRALEPTPPTGRVHNNPRSRPHGSTRPRPLRRSPTPRPRIAHRVCLAADVQWLHLEPVTDTCAHEPSARPRCPGPAVGRRVRARSTRDLFRHGPQQWLAGRLCPA